MDRGIGTAIECRGTDPLSMHEQHIERKFEPVNAAFAAYFACRGSPIRCLRRASKIKTEIALTTSEQRKPNLWCSWNTYMNAMNQRKNLQKNVLHMLPLRHIASRHRVCPNLKQAQGPLRGHNIPFYQKSITFPCILTYVIQIWTEFIKFFI
jgi:hypothetical protein